MRDCEEEGEPVKGVGGAEATAPYAPTLVEGKFSEVRRSSTRYTQRRTRAL
jgi:hypothetical protein